MAENHPPSPLRSPPPRYRMLAAVLAPVLALVAFSGYVVEEKLSTYRHSADLLVVAKIAQSAHGLARDLESERSISAFHIGIGRAAWRPELEDLRARTDQSLDSFRALVLEPRSRQIFGAATPDLGLGQLDAARAGVDGDADLKSSLVAYSRIIGTLIAQSSRLAASDSSLIAAYMDLGHIKDRIERERSLGVSWILQGRRQPELQSLFIEARAEKKAFLESFRGHASANQVRIFDELVRSAILDEIDRLQDQVVARKLGPADTDLWNRAHMALAEQVSRAEQRLAQEMEREIHANLSDAKTTFYLVVLVVVALVVFSLETLRRSERRATIAQDEARKLLRAVEQSPVSVMITDPGGNIEYINPAFTRMTGFGRDEVLGRNPRILRSDQTPKQVYAGMWHAIASGIDWRGEVVNRRKDGTAYWEQMIIAPVKNADGVAVNYIALKEDITEIRTLRQALEREHDNLRRILDATHDGIALLAADGSFQYANPALVAEFGEIDGRRCHEYFGGSVAPCVALSQAPEHNATTQGEWRAERTGKIYELTGTPVENADGSHSRLQVFHDITVRKQAEEALMAAREAAEITNRAKSDFLATMSHELRTPLNAIIGFSEIIEGELLGNVGQPQYVEYAHDINESGRHLLQLINDILDVARLEVGRVALREEQLDIAAIVRASINMSRERAIANGVSLDFKLPDHLPALWADERRLKQVLVNLLGNAVKFTPAGGRVTAATGMAADGGLEITVSDNGIGIAPEDIAKIMAPFGQADSGMARRYEGSGLGLPLSRKLMELHGGSLSLDSAPGIGTTVTLHFPAKRVRG